MQFLNVRELRLETPKVLRKVRNGGRVVITNRGKPQALLIGLSEDEVEDLVFRKPEFLRELDEARAEHRKKGGITLKEARKRLGL